MQVSAETTLAIVLGASEFPDCPELSGNEAFKRSACDFCKYLKDTDGLALPEKNVLDLFDNVNSPGEQNKRIREFIEVRTSEIAEAKLSVSDLIVYYVGHGGFSSNNQYFLALRSTVDGSEEITALPINTLANTLKTKASQLRRYLILDCCFSSAAYSTFQSGPLEVARQKTIEKLPSRGTALLCASGPRDPAKVPIGSKYTMFSGVFLDVLQTGSPDFPELLSLTDVGGRVKQLIDERFEDDGVRPQVLSPDQSQGTLADHPLFPNRGLGIRALTMRVSRLEDQIADLIQFQKRLQEVQASFRNAIDTANQQQEVVRKGADERLQNEPIYAHGMTKGQWDRIPPPVKSEILAYESRRRVSLVWLSICVGICAVAWPAVALPYLWILYTNGDGTTTRLITIAESLVNGLCIVSAVLFIIMPFQRILFGRQVSASPQSPEEPQFSSLDIVVVARSSKWTNVMGFELLETTYNITQILYFITFLVPMALKYSHIVRAA